MDLITVPEDKVDLSKFFLERYAFPFPSFYLSNTKQPPHNSHLQNRLLLLLPPVACAMLFSNIPSSHEHIYAHTKSILLPLSEYFQIQDDFLDHSVTPEVLGKIGTDIVDNKCSWVINTALLLTSEGGGKNTQRMRRR